MRISDWSSDVCSSDLYAGLAGRAEIGRHAARAHRAFEAEGRVHLADRAIGADREQALARAPLAVADRAVGARIADVRERAAVAPGRFDQCRHVAAAGVEGGGGGDTGPDTESAQGRKK